MSFKDFFSLRFIETHSHFTWALKVLTAYTFRGVNETWLDNDLLSFLSPGEFEGEHRSRENHYQLVSVTS